ncbi:unnamed protein product [Orchesella dallaii]|uniref:Actin n=1 Tax=Orchesella dallaii TaxID=48710 RepID=A0ABP1PVA3_9HEXA
MCDSGALVIDNGTGNCVAGFAGYDGPSTAVPSIVGHQKYEYFREFWGRDSFVGNDAQSKRGILNLHYPVKHGIVTNWNEMEQVWHHTFYNELRVNPDEHPILLTEAPLNPKNNRKMMTEIMFEKFSIPDLYVIHTAALPMLVHSCNTGSTNAVIVDSGDGVTYACPMFEGFALTQGVTRVDFGGRDISDYLNQMLREERGYQFCTPQTQREITRDMKEKLCYVSGNYDVELQNDNVDVSATYELPDGETIMIGAERFRCPEALFQPSLIGLSSSGIHEMVYESIQQCDPQIQEALYSNIVLCGGTSMLPGIVDRLEREIRTLAPQNMAEHVKIFADPDRTNLTWKGGSMAASLAGFPDICISKQEYDEVGSSIVHRKCF